MEGKIILDSAAMRRAISRISYEILERNRGAESLCVVGICSRGEQLAQRIASRLSEIEQVEIPVGALDITKFRDDGKTEEEPDHRTDMPFSVQDKNIVLVDDVMYTGRSVRAAIDALMEMGRPRTIQLAVLVDRGHRELPIRADYVGKNLPTSHAEEVRVLVKERDGIDQTILL